MPAVFLGIKQLIFGMWSSILFSYLNVIHFIQTICNHIVVVIAETQHIVAVSIPHHNYGVHDIPSAILPIDLFMFFVIVKIQKRNLFILINCPLYHVNVINYRTSAPLFTVK